MGTRGIIRVIDGDVTLVTIYSQYDSYPTGLGSDIKNALDGRELVNGYNDPTRQINGMGSAAAMLIASLADPKRTGGIYIVPPTEDSEEYDYTLSARDDEAKVVDVNSWHPDRRSLFIEVKSSGKALWSGWLRDFAPETV